MRFSRIRQGWRALGGLIHPLGLFPSQIQSVSLILMGVPIQAELENPTAKPRHCPPSLQAGGSPVALEAHHREGNLSLSPSRAILSPSHTPMKVIWKQELGANELTFSCTLHGWAFTTFLIKCVH